MRSFQSIIRVQSVIKMTLSCKERRKDVRSLYLPFPFFFFSIFHRYDKHITNYCSMFVPASINIVYLLSCIHQWSVLNPLEYLYEEVEDKRVIMINTSPYVCIIHTYEIYITSRTHRSSSTRQSRTSSIPYQHSLRISHIIENRTSYCCHWYIGDW